MPAQSTLLLPEGYSDNRLVSDLTRRQFGFGAGIAGLGAFLAARGASRSSSGETEMRHLSERTTFLSIRRGLSRSTRGSIWNLL